MRPLLNSAKTPYNVGVGVSHPKGEPMEKFVKPVCPKCGRANILYRVKTDDFVCRLCGHKFKKEA